MWCRGSPARRVLSAGRLPNSASTPPRSWPRSASRPEAMRFRSLLYVPAHQSRFVGRAHERGADAIVLDLEDSVPQDAKDAARAALATSVAAVGRGGATVFVRVNAGARREEDALAACLAGAYGLFVPKA